MSRDDGTFIAAGGGGTVKFGTYKNPAFESGKDGSALANYQNGNSRNRYAKAMASERETIIWRPKALGELFKSGLRCNFLEKGWILNRSFHSIKNGKFFWANFSLSWASLSNRIMLKVYVLWVSPLKKETRHQFYRRHQIVLHAEHYFYLFFVQIFDLLNASQLQLIWNSWNVPIILNISFLETKVLLLNILIFYKLLLYFCYNIETY